MHISLRLGQRLLHPRLLYSSLLFLLFEAALGQDSFVPATFQGLTLGKSTGAQMRAKFGRPKQTYNDRQGTIWYYYDNIGPVPGKVELTEYKGTVDFIAVHPSSLTVAMAKKLFGAKYRIVRYEFDLCLREGDGYPLYEDPNGQFEYIVYETLGVVIRPDGNRVRNDLTPVEAIEYHTTPIGSKRSQCP